MKNTAATTPSTSAKLFVTSVMRPMTSEVDDHRPEAVHGLGEGEAQQGGGHLEGVRGDDAPRVARVRAVHVHAVFPRVARAQRRRAQSTRARPAAAPSSAPPTITRFRPGSSSSATRVGGLLATVGEDHGRVSDAERGVVFLPLPSAARAGEHGALARRAVRVDQLLAAGRAGGARGLGMDQLVEHPLRDVHLVRDLVHAELGAPVELVRPLLPFTLDAGHGVASPVHLTPFWALSNIAVPHARPAQPKRGRRPLSGSLHAVKIPVSHGWLEAALKEPDDAPRGAAVVCHPHPIHGGTMHTKAVYRAAQGLNEAGLVALRFNFRGVGTSTGSHEEGIGEKDDVRAALDWLEKQYPTPADRGGGILLRLDGRARRRCRGRARGRAPRPRPPHATGRVRLLVPRRRGQPGAGGAGRARRVRSRREGGGISQAHGAAHHLRAHPGADHFFNDRLDELREAIRGYYASGPGSRLLATV